MSFKEYEIDDQDIAEWLPWGGLVRDCVLRNKDDSFLGIIQYDPIFISDEIEKEIRNQNYQKGWSIWTEEQHTPDFDASYFILSFNPFYNLVSSSVDNAIDNITLKRENVLRYFELKLKEIAKDLSTVTSVKILTYQEILDVLSFSLSLGENTVRMPEIPLYLDVLLSQDLNVEFLENGIKINDKILLVLSLPSIPDLSIMEVLREAFKKIPYRYNQRMLFFNKKDAKKEFDDYTNTWCSGRKYMRKSIQEGLLSNLNGFYSNTFIFHLEDEHFDTVFAYIQGILNTLELPYVFEQYNLKDTWWGSLPGIFRANINPLIVGFSSLNELLAHTLTPLPKEKRIQTITTGLATAIKEPLPKEAAAETVKENQHV